MVLEFRKNGELLFKTRMKKKRMAVSSRNDEEITDKSGKKETCHFIKNERNLTVEKREK